MQLIRRIISLVMLCLHVMLVSGGPVLAQYCCGQRVALDAVCARESCCPETEQCCGEMPVHETDQCCADDGELELEFTYVGAQEAAVSPTSVPDLAPTVVRTGEVQYRDCAHIVEDKPGVEAIPVLGEPPDLQLLGVLRL